LFALRAPPDWPGAGSAQRGKIAAGGSEADLA